jgi:hypothetical protein
MFIRLKPREAEVKPEVIERLRPPSAVFRHRVFLQNRRRSASATGIEEPVPVHTSGVDTGGSEHANEME